MIDGKVDPGHHSLHNGVQQRLFVGNVIIDRHRVDPQLGSQAAHGKSLEPLAVHQSERRSHNLLTPQRRSLNLLALAASG